MPELLALVFNYVDPLTRPCCRAVSRHWSASFELFGVVTGWPQDADPQLIDEQFCARLAAEGRDDVRAGG